MVTPLTLQFPWGARSMGGGVKGMGDQGHYPSHPTVPGVTKHSTRCFLISPFLTHDGRIFLSPVAQKNRVSRSGQ